MRGLKLRRIAVWLMNMEYIDNTSGFIITYYMAAYIYIMVKCRKVYYSHTTYLIPQDAPGEVCGGSKGVKRTTGER